MKLMLSNQKSQIQNYKQKNYLEETVYLTFNMNRSLRKGRKWNERNILWKSFQEHIHKL